MSAIETNIELEERRYLGEGKAWLVRQNGHPQGVDREELEGKEVAPAADPA